MSSELLTCIWYDDDLDEALASYATIFGDLHRQGDQTDPSGGLVATRFEILGRRLVGLQGGPGYPHSYAMSLYVLVDGGQAEVDRIWDGFLAEGAVEEQCAWLKDRFGISWQIVPVELERAVAGADPEKAAAAFQAMLSMKRIIIADLPI